MKMMFQKIQVKYFCNSTEEEEILSFKQMQVI